MRKTAAAAFVSLSMSAAPLLAAPPAPLANMVTNGDFDVDPAGWNGTGPTLTIVRDPLDALGSGASGSGLVTNSAIPENNSGVYQCISGIVPGTAYDFGAWIRVASGQEAGNGAGVFAAFYSDAGCSVQVGSNSYTGYVASDGSSGALDTWLLRTAQATAPAGAQTAWVYLNVQRGTGTGAFAARFDGVRLGPTPTTPVGLASFGAE